MKKLVNIHKHFFLFLFLLVSIYSGQAQVWTLKTCIDTAQVANKNLQIGRNNKAISTQKQLEAKANLIPKLTANADYKYFANLPYQLLPAGVFGGPAGTFKEAQFGVPHNINAVIQLMMPLYNPQLLGAIQTTKIATELTDLQYLKAEEQVYFDISNLYYTAQVLHHQIRFIDSNLLNSNRLLQTMQLLKSQLLAKGTDVSKVQLQVEQLTTQKALVSSKYEQVLNALKLAMGVDISKNMDIDPQVIYQNNRDYERASPLEIRFVQTQNRLLTSELQTLKNSRLPTLSLMGSYGTTGFGYDKSPNDFLKFFPLSFGSVQVAYPLFNGTVTQRKINQKNLELDNSRLQISLATEQNAAQTDNAKLQKSAAQKSVETSLSQIQLAQSIYQQTILQQKQGVATITDVLLADNVVREAQQNHLSAIVEYLKADLELKKLTGNIKN